jgi:hypothetical protein
MGENPSGYARGHGDFSGIIIFQFVHIDSCKQPTQFQEGRKAPNKATS